MAGGVQQLLVGGVHWLAVLLRDYTFGLFDNCSFVQRGLGSGQYLGGGDGCGVHDRQGGQVGEYLHGLPGEGSAGGKEQVEGTDGIAVPPHGYGVDGVEPGPLECFRDRGPAVVDVGGAGGGDGFTGFDGVKTGALLVLGLCTRLATIPLIVSMIVAILTAKLADIHNVFDLVGADEFTYLCVLIMLALIGPGKVSLDRLLARSMGWSSKD